MNFESVCFHHSRLCFRGRKFIFQALFPPQNFANLLFPISPQSKKILMQLILERKNCSMLGWILGSFQIYLSHFNHSPLRYSWVDNLIFRSNWNFGNVNFWRKGKTKEENQEQQFQSQATTGLDGKTQIHRSLAGGECFLPLRHPKIAPFSEFPRLVSCFRILTRVRQRFFNLTLVKLTKK